MSHERRLLGVRGLDIPTQPHVWNHDLAIVVFRPIIVTVPFIDVYSIDVLAVCCIFVIE